MKISKQVRDSAVVVAGAGALNVGLNEFLKFNLLSFIPAGMFSTVAYAIVGLSGAIVIYGLVENKI